MQITDYKIYRDEIPLNTVKTWNAMLMNNIDWRYTGWTGNPREPYRHWAAYPEFSKEFKEIWDCMNFSFREDGFRLQPDRVIANLYSFGDSSWIHTDTDKPGDWTAIIYLNDYWDLGWGGGTILVDDDRRDIIATIPPMPGNFALFRSDMFHAATPVSREAPYPRFGLTFQCKNDKNVS